MITTTKGFRTKEQRERHVQMYLRIGYKVSEIGKRVPNGTVHKLILHHLNDNVTLYHQGKL